MAQYYVTRMSETRVRVSFNPLDLPTATYGWWSLGDFKFYTPSASGPQAYWEPNPIGADDFLTCDFSISGLPPLFPPYTRLVADSGVKLTDDTFISFDYVFPEYTGPKQPADPPTILSVTPKNRSFSVSIAPPANTGSSPLLAYDLLVITTGETVTYPIGTSLTWTGSLLTNGQAYQCAFRSRNEQGNGSLGGFFTVTPTQTVPGSPTINFVTGGNNKLTVNKTGPSDTGGYSLTGFDYSLDGGITSTPLAITSTGTLSFDITGLTNGVTYSVTLRAKNLLGAGAWSNAVTGVPVTVPSAPVISQLTSGIGQLTASYTESSNTGGSPIIRYEYSLNSGGSFFSVGFNNPFTITGLLNGTTYNVVLRAVNAVGNGAWSAPVSGTTFSAPSAPTITSITSGNQQLTVAFTAPSSDGGTPITSYQYSTNNGGTYTATGTTSPFTISGLTNGTTYSVKLRAVNAVGPGTASATVTGTPKTVPAAPVITTITPASNALTVSYTLPDNGGSPITSVKRSVNGGAFVSAGLANPFTITGLENGTLYSLVLKAENAVGLSTPSDPVSALTPTTYKVYAVSDRVARIEFDSTYFPIPPRHVASTGDKDALNPRTWQIVQLYDTVPVTSKTLTVLSVLAGSDYIYDIFTLEHFERANGPQLWLSTPDGLKLQDGSTITIGAEGSAYFNGSIQANASSQNAKTAARGYSVRDLANVPTPYADLVGGTLVITDSGDYASMSGEQFVRKLVLRRLLSKRGDFFHLPNYGAGLGVKSTFSTANMRMMAKEIEMQVLQEPEIEQAKATLTYQAADSTLIVQVRARMRSTGQVSTISLNLPAGSIQF